MLGILKTAFKYGAGLAGLAAIFFLLVVKQWITSSLFAEMSAQHTFYSFIISMVIAFVLSLLFLICHFKEKKAKDSSSVIISADNNSNAINNTGNGNVTVRRGR